MKAILEFNYPDDENKLRRALHADIVFDALNDVRQNIRTWEKHDGTSPEMLIEKIKVITAEALYQTGED